jgi:hypothetical protein
MHAAVRRRLHAYLILKKERKKEPCITNPCRNANSSVKTKKNMLPATQISTIIKQSLIRRLKDSFPDSES